MYVCCEFSATCDQRMTLLNTSLQQTSLKIQNNLFSLFFNPIPTQKSWYDIEKKDKLTWLGFK